MTTGNNDNPRNMLLSMSGHPKVPVESIDIDLPSMLFESSAQMSVRACVQQHSTLCVSTHQWK